MTTKRILEIINEEQEKTEQQAEKWANRYMTVMDGGHDPLSIESIQTYCEMTQHRIDALGSLKIRIYHEMQKEKEQSKR